MSHDWTPEEWAEMDGFRVVRFAEDYYGDDGADDLSEWLKKIPTPVLADAILWAEDQYWTNARIRQEAARRLLEREDTLKRTWGYCQSVIDGINDNYGVARAVHVYLSDGKDEAPPWV